LLDPLLESSSLYPLEYFLLDILLESPSLDPLEYFLLDLLLESSLLDPLLESSGLSLNYLQLTVSQSVRPSVSALSPSYSVSVCHLSLCPGCVLFCLPSVLCLVPCLCRIITVSLYTWM
jgi:hypothetical protein